MKGLFILPGELAARVEYKEDHCVISLRAEITLLERECNGMSDLEIGAACLQATIADRAIFPCEDPKLTLPPRRPAADWEFSARFRALVPPLLDGAAVANDLVSSLHDDDLASLEGCRERLIKRVQSLINPVIPEHYLGSMKTPVEAIEVWSRELALAALGDMPFPGADHNLPRDKRIERAIDWVLSHAVSKSPRP